jgi:hypothetical protein
MEGKRIGLPVTGADTYEDNAENMFTAFDRIVDFLLAKKICASYMGKFSVPAEITQDAKKMAVELARALVN